MIIAVAAYDSVAAHLSRIAYQADVGVSIELVTHHHGLAVVINRYDVLFARDDFVRLHKAFARKVRCRSRNNGLVAYVNIVNPTAVAAGVNA